MGQPAITSVLSTQGQRPNVPQQRHDDREGMRSCLLRIRRFIASDESASNQGSQESTSVSPHKHVHSLYPAHQSQHQLQEGIPHAYQPQATVYQYSDTTKQLSSPTACAHSPDPVWRPWPQSWFFFMWLKWWILFWIHFMPVDQGSSTFFFFLKKRTTPSLSINTKG